MDARLRVSQRGEDARLPKQVAHDDERDALDGAEASWLARIVVAELFSPPRWKRLRKRKTLCKHESQEEGKKHGEEECGEK